MPLYSFINSKGESRDVFFGMNDNKDYRGENGKETDWQRVWTKPQAAISTRLDPFSQQAFIDKLGTGKGTMGDAWDRSQELAAIRKQKAGRDPVKEQYFKKERKKRKGKESMAEMKERISDLKFTV